MTAEDSLVETLPVYKIFQSAEIAERHLTPAFETLHDMALEAFFRNREYGCQVSRIRPLQEDISFLTTYAIGDANNILEPERKTESVDGVFFHTHFQHDPTLIDSLKGKEIRSWYMLPSDLGLPQSMKTLEVSCDMYAQKGSKQLGGYFNIVTPFHWALHIWQENRSEFSVPDSQWEIIEGTQKGRIFTWQELLKDTKSKPDNVMVWRNKWTGGLQNHFLVLSLPIANKFEREIGSVKGLCYGNGVAVLMDRLGLQHIPHAQNLSEITKLS